MLGTIIGDIIGSAYEFSGYKNKTFTPFFPTKSRPTNDTICTVGIAQALLDDAALQPPRGQPDDIKAVITRFDKHQRKKPPTIAS